MSLPPRQVERFLKRLVLPQVAKGDWSNLQPIRFVSATLVQLEVQLLLL